MPSIELIEKTCANCGATFKVESIGKKKKRQFCSKSCASSFRFKDEDYLNMHKKHMKEVANRESVRASKSRFQKEYQNMESVKSAKSVFMKEKWSDDNFKQIVSEKLKLAANQTDNKELHSTYSKERWDDVNFKEIMSKKQREVQNRDHVREAKSAFQKEYQNREYVKQYTSEYMKKHHSQLHVKNSTSERMCNFWRDEKFACQRMETMFKYKDYELPSGRIVKLQGYEPQVLTELLKTYSEDDIIVGVKEMNAAIGRIKYTLNEKESTYYPDFYIKSTHTIIEVKSKWTYEKWKEKNLAKEQACLQQGFNFEFIIL